MCLLTLAAFVGEGGFTIARLSDFKIPTIQGLRFSDFQVFKLLGHAGVEAVLFSHSKICCFKL